MQAGTEFAMVSCFRRGSWGGEMTFYETPFTRATASPGKATPLLGERSSLLTLVPFSWRTENKMYFKTVLNLNLMKLFFYSKESLKTIDDDDGTVALHTPTYYQFLKY